MNSIRPSLTLTIGKANVTTQCPNSVEGAPWFSENLVSSLNSNDFIWETHCFAAVVSGDFGLSRAPQRARLGAICPARRPSRRKNRPTRFMPTRSLRSVLPAAETMGRPVIRVVADDRAGALAVTRVGEPTCPLLRFMVVGSSSLSAVHAPGPCSGPDSALNEGLQRAKADIF